MEKYKNAIVFTVATYLLSFIILYTYIGAGGVWGSGSSIAVGVLYMAIPMLVAIVLQRFVYKKPVVRPLGISFAFNRWFLVAWFIAPIIVLLTIGVSLLIPGVGLDTGMEGMFASYESIIPPDQMDIMKEQLSNLPVHFFWVGLLQGLVAGITINALAAFGEEVGWRGFLQREFADMGFWKSSLVIGIIWGFWHAPIILQGHNYPNYPVAGVFMMVIFTTLVAPIFSYLRLKARSVIAAAIAHGTINATLALTIIMVYGGHDLLIGGTGLAGFIALALVNIAIYVYDTRIADKPINTQEILQSEHKDEQINEMI